jgi:hypothetical protein
MPSTFKKNSFVARCLLVPPACALAQRIVERFDMQRLVQMRAYR